MQSEANAVAQISNPDRVPQGEVYEKNWPLVYLGKGRVEKGKVKLIYKIKVKTDPSFELKTVILKKRIKL